MKNNGRHFLPPNLPAALVAAASAPVDHIERVALIDQVTQEAADQYPELLRQPSDTSRSDEWDARRAAWPS